MIVVGLVAGLSAALAVGQLLSSMFFGLKPTLQTQTSRYVAM
jgi:hypothetical protein